MKHTRGAIRAGRKIYEKLHKHLPQFAEANAETLACIIDIETKAPVLLAVCKEVYAELNDRYDVDQPAGEPRKEYPFQGAGHLLSLLRAAIDQAEGGA